MADEGPAEPASSRAYIDIDGGGKLDCYFNPTEYSVAKANSWEAIQVNGKPSPDPEVHERHTAQARAEPPLRPDVPAPTRSPWATRRSMLLDAMEVPGGTKSRHADLRAAVLHVRLGPP